MITKSSVFWDITPCSPLKSTDVSEEHAPPHSGLKGKQSKETSILDLLFNPDEGGDILLRNVGGLSTDYTALYPRRKNHLCENLRSYNKMIS
jgi:hypothetical protein